MPDTTSDYKRPGRLNFLCRGVDVNSPYDFARARGKFPALLNVIVGTDGTLETRPGLVDRYASYVPAAGLSPAHTFKRLNDSSSGSKLWALFSAIGGSVFIEKSSTAGSFSLADSGYSGSPITIITDTPPKSVQPWAYVSDSARMRKIDIAGNVHLVGLPRPEFEPVTFADTGYFKAIDLFEPSGGGTGYTRWAAGGTGTVVGAVAGKRVNTTITAKVQVFSAAGSLAVVIPASMANIGVGCVLSTITAGPATEDILVTQVNRPTAATTITNIIYDSGTTGNACLVIGISPSDIEENCALFNSTRGEYARVISRSQGTDNSFSFRVSTTGTWQAGDAISAVASFVCHPFGILVVGQPLTSEALSVTMTAGTATFSQTLALDMTNFADPTGSFNFPASVDDLIHLSTLIDNIDNISEIKLFLDVDRTTNDFTRNYYFATITPADIIAVTKNKQNVLDNRQQQIRNSILSGRFGNIGGRRQFDTADPNPVSNPDGIDIPLDSPTDASPPRDTTGSGDSQWSEIRIPLNSFQRIGTDDARGLRNVAALRIQIICTANVAMYLDSWCMHGGFEPDTGDVDTGYQYAYRARVKSTGVVSDLSPLARNQVFTRRQRVALQLQQYTSASEADQLDVFRVGGTLEFPTYLGSVANGASPVFLDVYSDLSAAARQDATLFDFNDPDLAPWPILDIPRSGTCSTCGSTVTSSAQFNTNWWPGTPIVINGITTIIYRVISTSKLETLHSLGSQGGVSWEVPEPVLLAQPLPIRFGGPLFHDHQFGLGDLRNPGTLYYSKSKQPDSTSLRRRLTITDNSDPLQNGFVFNGRGGVFSSQRMFYLEYDSSSESFAAFESPSVKGLYARNALAVGRRGVAWLASDGVYIMEGGGAKNLTDADLRPLFPFGGKQGVTTNGVVAPYMPNPIGSEESYLRLFYDANDNLRFVYRDSGGALYCLLYDFSVEGWFPLKYQKPVCSFYSEEGAGVRSLLAGSSESTGHVYTVGGTGDDARDAGTGIDGRIDTYAYDFDDPRGEKQVGDIDVDVDPNGTSLTVTPFYNNYASSVAPTTITGSGRTNPPKIIDLSSGSGVYARNIALRLTWTTAANTRPRFFVWEPAYIPHPEDTYLRATDSHSAASSLYVRGVYIEANTAGATRSVNLEYTDDSGVLQTIAIAGVTHPIKGKVYYPLNPPFYGYNVRLHPTDGSTWKLYAYDLDADPAPPFSTQTSKWDDDGEISNKFLQGGVIDVDTMDTIASFDVEGDDGNTLATIANVSTSQRSQIPFILDPAVRTHIMRIVPLTPMRIFGVRWDYQHDAELVTYYEGQETSDDVGGYKHIREIYVAYSGASNPLTLTLTLDGSPLVGIPPLPPSASYVRYRILLPAKKYLARKPVLTSTSPFYLYSRDCAVMLKPWSSDGDYEELPLFGTVHRDRGVAVI